MGPYKHGSRDSRRSWRGQFLAEEDDLNFTDELTHEKPEEAPKATGTNNHESFVSIDIPPITPDNFPTMTTEDDSVSTFHPKAIVEELNILSDPTTTYTKKLPRNQ